jgi:hypothetical protein
MRDKKRMNKIFVWMHQIIIIKPTFVNWTEFEIITVQLSTELMVVMELNMFLPDMIVNIGNLILI